MTSIFIIGNTFPSRIHLYKTKDTGIELVNYSTFLAMCKDCGYMFTTRVESTDRCTECLTKSEKVKTEPSDPCVTKSENVKTEPSDPCVTKSENVKTKPSDPRLSEETVSSEPRVKEELFDSEMSDDEEPCYNHFVIHAERTEALEGLLLDISKTVSQHRSDDGSFYYVNLKKPTTVQQLKHLTGCTNVDIEMKEYQDLVIKGKRLVKTIEKDTSISLNEEDRRAVHHYLKDIQHCKPLCRRFPIERCIENSKKKKKSRTIYRDSIF